MARVEAAPLLACPCTLAWNPSQDSSVAGYALYFGIVDSGTTNRLDVGMTNVITLNTLLASSNYFFYVVAYNGSEVESPPSDVMYYTPQALSSLTPNMLMAGSLNLHFLAPTGAVCHVEFTSTMNPPQWQTLGGAIADANGNVTITDALTGSPPIRFYRAVLP
ncbi:MAG: fibronectin type III domain-containing protein [Verrucomicrobiia bacterium]